MGRRGDGRAPPLDLALAAGGGGSIGVFLDEDEVSRTDYAGRAAAFAMFVFGMATERVVRMPDVQVAVCHLENADEEGQDSIPRRKPFDSLRSLRAFASACCCRYSLACHERGVRRTPSRMAPVVGFEPTTK
jgi:hypothetical protein